MIPFAKQVKNDLRYIAASPDRSHGGFHPKAVEAAKVAMKRINALEAEVRKLKDRLMPYEKRGGI